MAKAELFKVPVLSQLVRALCAYPVRRGGADVGAIRNTITMLGEGKTVGMFPQGTRRKGVDPRTTEVRSGAGMIAVKAGVPVLPVYIKTKDNCPRIFRRIDIYVGKPVTAEEIGYDGDSVGEYARISNLLFEKVCALGDN
jgi:1-acyl-sn-glycerol-3-phosphate acyltransferase